MNGIAGVLYPDVFQINHLMNPMLETISRRGTNLRDSYIFKNAQVGICGHPLISNEKKNIRLALDGTIYNRHELGNQLKHLGYHLDPNNSAQIVLAAYEAWGIDFLKKLNGEFAMAILDESQNHFILARDRIGKKPLYWYQDKNLFLFSSEIKGLLATGAVPQTYAPDALSAYFYLGYVPQDMTPIQGVNKLLPSYYLQLHFDHRKNIISYWSYSEYFKQQTPKVNMNIPATLAHLLDSSVEAEIPSEDPIGCFISGGLGSASVAYHVSKFVDKSRIQAFSVGFKGENEADIEAAKKVSNTLGIAQNSQMVTPETILDHLPKIIWYMDEPLGDPNVTATWRLAQMAKGSTPVVFSGMGSDELLAGHTRYTFDEQHTSPLKRFMQLPLSIIRPALISVAKTFYPSLAFELVKTSRTDFWQFDYLEKNALFNEKQLAQLSPRLATVFDPQLFLHKFYHISRLDSKVASFLYFDVKTRLADCFIAQYERAAKAHGLEWCTPYLDRSIVEFAATLPEPESLEESGTAHYLKMILKEVFPDSFVNRPKRTRPDFLKTWTIHPEILEVFQMLPKGTLVEAELISKEWLIATLGRLPGKRNVFAKLWAILVLEIWVRLFIDKPILASAPDISVKELLS